MLISTDHHAGEIVSTDDETRFYDDIGCLAADWSLHRDHARAFVSVENGRWIDTRDAAFALPAGERTAMGSGLVALATAAEARAVDGAGRAITFDEIVKTSGEEKK